MKKFLTTFAALAALAVPSAFGQYSMCVSIGTPSEISTPQTQNSLTMDASGTFTGYFNVEGGQSFVFYLNGQIALAPSEDEVTVTLANVGSDYNGTADMMGEGYWTLAGSEEALVKMEVSFSDFSVTFTRVDEIPVEPTNPVVTFNFTGVTDAWKYISVTGFNGASLASNPITGEDWENEISMSNYQFNFVITSQYQTQYKISGITCTNSSLVDDDLVIIDKLNDGVTDYQVTVSPASSDVDGAVITVTVEDLNAPAGNFLNLKFTGDDLGVAPYTKVSAINMVRNIPAGGGTPTYDITNITMTGEVTPIQLGEGGYIFVQPADGYSLDYTGNDASYQYLYYPYKLDDASAASMASDYGIDIKGGTYYFTYNTEYSFENNVTLTFDVMVTPPNATLAFVDGADLVSTQAYRAVEVTDLNTNSQIYSLSASNKLDLPWNLKVAPMDSYVYTYAIENFEISNNGTPIAESAYSTYGITVTPEDGAYIITATTAAEGLTFSFTVAEETVYPTVTLNFARGEGLANDVEAYEGVALSINSNSTTVDEDSYEYKVTDYTTFRFEPASDEYKLTGIAFSNNNGPIEEDDISSYGYLYTTGDEEEGFIYSFSTSAGYSIEGLKITVTVSAADATTQTLSASLEFAGGENAYRNVVVMDMANDGDVVTLDSNRYTFAIDEQMGAAYMVAANAGATIESIRTPEGEILTAEDQGTETEAYQLMNMGSGSWFLMLYPVESLNNAVFTFTVAGGVEEGNLPVYLAGGVQGYQASLPTLDLGLVDEDDTNVWTGEFTIQPNNPFRFYTYAESADNGDNDPEMGGGSTNPWMPLGSAEDDVNLDFTAADDEVTTSLMQMSMDYWTLVTYNPWKVNITVDMNAMEVTIVAIEEVVPAPETPTICPVTPVVLPADKSVLNSLSVVEISWAGYTVAENEDNENGNPTLNGKTVPYDIQNNKLYISVNAEETGVYTIFVPEGLLILTNADGDEYINGAINASYNVNITFETLWLNTPISVTPANNSNVEDLYEVVVEWELPLYVNPENTVQPTLNGKTVYGVCEGNTLVFNFDALAAGKYTLVIPAMYVAGEDVQEGFVDVYYNRALTLNYVVVESEGPEGPDGPSTGIAFVEADANGLYRVYSLTGANVMNTKDGSELLRLAKGMYIINGQKVIIR